MASLASWGVGSGEQRAYTALAASSECTSGAEDERVDIGLVSKSLSSEQAEFERMGGF